MSQYPPASSDQPRSFSTGLAIGALVCGICGLCIPGLGLVGIILGIVALSKAGSSPQTHGGKGMAIAGIIVGALSFIFVFLSIGIMLPALGKARESARQMVSASNMRQIGIGLMTYAGDNKDWYPEAGADIQSRLSTYGLPATMFHSPRADPGVTDSYIYIPGYRPSTVVDHKKTILMYENPRYVPHGKISVLFADGRVEFVSVDQFQSVLNASPKPVAEPKPRTGGGNP